ncbi:hypothetical protein CBG46_05800 [Actinobacillus succinogenes]|uniref:Factor H binding protein-like C-terminal domain-containing protein n=1 Tax=Actinobacillus succinogenes (strain ATCC 55618 / DSM 22257 / CCUG 43843 / 130Z) TaxID=339671 RepID=A6VQZ7_ACTSZ|nr:factor H binding protein domain-containing protein [Actinobacillus succinogenes]ABR75394.1 hypothetical protein Asuc_2048 [Actinobacillus succinogenes 130Z]PHI40218.1 hypothetical protein CBG46_05800 [Actinobacillus succinogenes]
MKKFIFSTLLVACLTACSGGGGGGGTAETPDGTRIDLSHSPKGDIVAKTTDGEFYGKNHDDSFYGVWINDTKTIKEVRYQGTPATNLPSGSATYIGTAYWVDGITGLPSKGGRTVLNADFSQKTIDGKIEFNMLNDGRLQDITLHKTQLNGAKFDGVATTISQTGTYEGGLFGKDAKEAAGIATFNDSSYNTAFGGIRY